MKRLLPILAMFLLAVSCSTTRVLEEGQYRLTSTKITVTDEVPPDFNEKEVRNYIRQDAGNGGILSFNPFLYVYNWSKKDGVLHKLGTPPLILDENAVEPSIENMQQRLIYMGYYDSRVDSRIHHKGKKASVEYLLTLGKRYPIEKVVFEVPEYDSFHSDFMADSSEVISRLEGNYLSEKLLESESVISSSRMRNLGYYSLNKSNYTFEADTLGGGTLLYYRVGEYGRELSANNAKPLNKYNIGDVSITLPSDLRFRETLLKEITTVRPGQPYNETEINTTYSRLSSLKTFSNVRIEMTEADSTTVDCSINLSRSPAQGFKVNLEGSTNSNGLFSVSPEFSFFHKNIFHGGEWLSLGFNGDFQFMLNSDVRATEFGVSAGLSFPRFLGIPISHFKGVAIPRTDLNASFNRQSRPEYTRNIFSLSFGYTGLYRKRLSYQFSPLRINFVRLYNLDNDFIKSLYRNPYLYYSYSNHLDAGVSLTTYYNSSTDIIPQSSYYFHRFNLDLSGNVIALFTPLMKANDGIYNIAGSPFAQYIKGEYSLGGTLRFGKDENQGLAARLLIGAGFAYGNSTAMPFEKQFYAGGASSMRGWQARDLGPGYSQKDEAFSIPSQTGDMKLEMNLEYRFRLFWKLEGALFADVGNVWNLKYPDTEEGLQSAFLINDFYNSLASDWGAGVRLNMNFILVRIDFGMKLRDPSLPEGGRIIGPDQWLKRGNNAVHFGIGYPF